MKTGTISIIILVSVSLCIMISSPADAGTKSPMKAFTIAFLPGFFIHGMGHGYIGDTKMAKILLYTEFASLTTMAVGTALVAAGSTAENVSFDKTDTNPLKSIGTATIALGMIGFTGSWAYDFIKAPALVNKFTPGTSRINLVSLRYRFR